MDSHDAVDRPGTPVTLMSAFALVGEHGVTGKGEAAPIDAFFGILCPILRASG